MIFIKMGSFEQKVDTKSVIVCIKQGMISVQADSKVINIMKAKDFRVRYKGKATEIYQDCKTCNTVVDCNKIKTALVKGETVIKGKINKITESHRFIDELAEEELSTVCENIKKLPILEIHNSLGVLDIDYTCSDYCKQLQIKTSDLHRFVTQQNLECNGNIKELISVGKVTHI